MYPPTNPSNHVRKKLTPTYRTEICKYLRVTSLCKIFPTRLPIALSKSLDYVVRKQRMLHAYKGRQLRDTSCPFKCVRVCLLRYSVYMTVVVFMFSLVLSTVNYGNVPQPDTHDTYRESYTHIHTSRDQQANESSPHPHVRPRVFSNKLYTRNINK